MVMFWLPFKHPLLNPDSRSAFSPSNVTLDIDLLGKILRLFREWHRKHTFRDAFLWEWKWSTLWCNLTAHLASLPKGKGEVHLCIHVHL